MMEVPHCKFCGRRMQLNTAASSSTSTVKQYLCGCRGIVYYKNVVEFGTLKLRPKKEAK